MASLRRRPLVLLVVMTTALQAPRQRTYSRRIQAKVTVPVPLEYAAELAATASALVAPGKGVLSIDESPPTLRSRFERAGIELADDDDAIKYRELVVATPDLGTYVSGCVLSADALFEETEGGTPFVDLLAAQNILPGVRVDCGDVQLPGAVEGETCSRGLDGLEERAALYREQGARFAKWRGKILIDDSRGAPSFLALKETCWTMARTARTLQECGLVPLLEPAVLSDGDHTIERAAEVQERVYVDVFRALAENGVFLEGCLLKPMMSTPGTQCPEAATPELVAAYSVRTLERTVPSAVPGVCFNAGPLGEEEASLCLDAMNRIERKGPWSVTFGFASSLQTSCIKTWAGALDNSGAAQQALIARCRANGEANLGKYAPGSQPTLDTARSLAGDA
jgi:fructose-bisphosphate aldolase class I